VLVLAVALVLLCAWTYRQVDASLREVRAATMKSLLDSQINALRLWIGGEMGDAERIAREPRVRDAIVQLVRERRCSGPARQQLETVLRPLLRDVGDATFNVLDADGRLLATRFEDYCDLRASAAFLAEVKPVFEGHARFVRPFGELERIVTPARLRGGTPIAWMYAPVRGADGRVIAALGLAEPVDAVFADILRAARPGKSGEAFAFDRSGTVLTTERFDQKTSVSARPEGLVLDPYLSHRGVEVIGVWRWLPEYSMGVALEIEAGEAYAPLRHLKIAFGVVLGVLVIAVLAAAAGALSAIRLRRASGGARR
jgi:eukaryotic-like serine/threonine-protein kinase